MLLHTIFPPHVSGRALHRLGIPWRSELGFIRALLVADRGFATTTVGAYFSGNRQSVGGASLNGVIHSMKALTLAAAALAVVNGSARAESGIASSIRRANWAQGLPAVAICMVVH
jgi:hypothetical protein